MGGIGRVDEVGLRMKHPWWDSWIAAVVISVIAIAMMLLLTLITFWQNARG